MHVMMLKCFTLSEWLDLKIYIFSIPIVKFEMDFSPDFQNFTGSGLDVLETNQSCTDLSLQSNGPLLPSALDIAIRMAQVLFFSVRNVIALALNGLIVFLVIKFWAFSFGIAAMLATTNLSV